MTPEREDEPAPPAMDEPGGKTFFDELLQLLGYGAREPKARCKTLRDFFKVILAGEPHIPVD
jgi:hypothetical protein